MVLNNLTQGGMIKENDGERTRAYQWLWNEKKTHCEPFVGPLRFSILFSIGTIKSKHLKATDARGVI